MTVSSPSLLTNLETCPRKGYYSRSYASERLPVKEMVSWAIRQALLAPSQPEPQQWGEYAGDQMMQIASDRPLEEAETLHRTYPCVIHHACLSDLLVSTIRKPADPPWLIPPSEVWTPDCFLAPDGNSLRRIVLVSHWTDERAESEKRSWYSLGEIAQYNLPMQIVVFVIGQMRNGKRSSPWTTGFLHPQNRQLRFRKKSRSTSETFNDKWEKICREDHAEIDRQTWLNAMLKDYVMNEVVFRVDVPVPGEVQRQQILDTSNRKLERLYGMKEKPEPNLSTCNWPIPCEFRRCCHAEPEREPSEKYGYVRIQTTPA